MPGRIIGRTVDLEVKQVLLLTYKRVNNIFVRRAKATSIFVPNQVLP